MGLVQTEAACTMHAGRSEAGAGADSAVHDEVSIADSIPDIPRDEQSDQSPTPRIFQPPPSPFSSLPTTFHSLPPTEAGTRGLLSSRPSLAASGSLASCTSASQSLAQMILDVRPMGEGEDAPARSVASQLLLGVEVPPACCSLGEGSDSTHSGPSQRLGLKAHSSWGSLRPEGHSPRSGDADGKGGGAGGEPKARRRFAFWGLFSGGSRPAEQPAAEPPTRDVEQGLAPAQQ